MVKLFPESNVTLRILVLTAVAVVFVAGCFFVDNPSPTPTPPPKCGNLCSYEFWESATLRDVEMELAAGADVNGAKGSNFNSPLHQAIEHNGNAAIIKLLLEQGADPDASGYVIEVGHHGGDDWWESPRTPLQLAAEQQYERHGIIQTLLEHGADPNPSTELEFRYSKGEESPLYYAARLWTDEDKAVIKLLLEHGADANAKSSTAGNYGVTPFHRAMYEADPIFIELFLDYGADIHARTNHENYGLGGRYATPLHVAADASRNPDAIATLLEHGADAKAKNAVGETPLHLASSDRLYFESLGYSPAIDQRNLEVAKLLLDHSADVNAKDDDDRTPLHSATEHSASHKLVALLLDHGADVNAKDEGGVTPLHWAAKCSSGPEVVALLLEYGAEVNAKTVASGFYRKSEQTPLHSSVEPPLLTCVDYEWQPNAQVISLLIEKGGDLNATNESGMTPCQFAEVYEAPSEIRHLLCR